MISQFIKTPDATGQDVILPTAEGVKSYVNDTFYTKEEIDAAGNVSVLLTTEPTADSTDAQITSAKRLWTMMGAAFSTLATTAKTIVGAINELFTKQEVVEVTIADVIDVATIAHDFINTSGSIYNCNDNPYQYITTESTQVQCDGWLTKFQIEVSDTGDIASYPIFAMTGSCPDGLTVGQPFVMTDKCETGITAAATPFTGTFVSPSHPNGLMAKKGDYLFFGRDAPTTANYMKVRYYNNPDDPSKPWNKNGINFMINSNTNLVAYVSSNKWLKCAYWLNSLKGVISSFPDKTYSFVTPITDTNKGVTQIEMDSYVKKTAINKTYIVTNQAELYAIPRNIDVTGATIDIRDYATATAVIGGFFGLGNLRIVCNSDPGSMTTVRLTDIEARVIYDGEFETKLDVQRCSEVMFASNNGLYTERLTVEAATVVIVDYAEIADCRLMQGSNMILLNDSSSTIDITQMSVGAMLNIGESANVELTLTEEAQGIVVDNRTDHTDDTFIRRAERDIITYESGWQLA